jgi:hypothetical protein
LQETLQETAMTHLIKWRREAVLDAYNLLLGAFLFASPWLVASTRGPMGEEAWVSGALIILISAASLVAYAKWKEWIVLALGLWLAISPWALGFHNSTAMKINVGIGLLVAYFAALELFLVYDSAPQRTDSPGHGHA